MKVWVLLIFLILNCSTKTFEKTVPSVERDRFMGSWYVQAGRFTMFESNPYNAVETYTWNEKEKRIDIDFHYNKGSFEGELKKMPQKGWIENTTTNAHWKVQPFWPIKADYLIIALDKDYQWTAIGVPDEKYLWIMSRNPQFPKNEVQKILNDLDADGYSIRDIEWVKHKKSN